MAMAPLEWQGTSRRIYFGRDRGAMAFAGIFAYSLHELPDDRKRLFLMLAQFAVFSGTGRLTAQGFGQTRMEWR